jgi:hypothetical protein
MTALFSPPAFDTPCTIEITHTAASLAAHVSLGADRTIGPGDKVTIHGAPASVPFGATLTIALTATVQPAGLIVREWTKLCARFSLAELYEVSFSPGRLT